MKITRLYLKNFAHILSGLQKYEIELDLSKSDKVVNVIIGKMGSCKTVILGNLQPYASFGTLDVRNQDTVVIEGFDGQKIIEYCDGPHYYKITHEYIWNKTSHQIKSYLEKDGNELNPNGNQGSFKDMIEMEFGIEQNFLRLLRLGSNVANVIRMKSTERKSFIASLSKEAEVYTMLYKKLSEDLRTLNSQVNVLSNKLNHIGVSRIAEYQSRYQETKDKLADLMNQQTELKSRMYTIKAKQDVILSGYTFHEYQDEYTTLKDRYQKILSSKEELEQSIKAFKGMPTINEVSKILGGLDNKNNNLQEKIMEEEKHHKNLTADLSSLIDRNKMITNEEHMNELHRTYDELYEKSQSLSQELSSFKSSYSAAFITATIGDINTISILIDEISQYNKELITKIYHSDSSIVKWAAKQIEYIGYKKLKIQAEINNIRYSDKYEAPGIMYLPPFCPTEDCPYYKTHPAVIKSIHKDDMSEKLEEIHNQVDALDTQTYIYESYPVIYSKIITVKQLWKKLTPVLKNLNALNADNLLLILTNLQYRRWYDYDKLSRHVELSEKRDKYYQLVEDLNKIKNELATIELSKDSNIDVKIVEYEKSIDESVILIEEYCNDQKMVIAETESYNAMYLELSNLSEYESELVEISTEGIQLSEKLSHMDSNIEEIQNNQHLLEKMTLDDLQLSSSIKHLTEDSNNLQTILNDISYTKEEYDKIFEDKNYLKYIIDAVSSKEGIPLIIVKLFLNNCKEIINELVSDVFGDTIEILDFKISEDEFKIPYAINGTMVEDIEKASQGQQSIISIALSFALIRQSMFKYNIMLLDEVDGPLYKHDRNKFITILFKQLQAINAEQVFLISHNNTFDGFPVNIIMTTDEVVDRNSLNTIMRI